MNARKWIVLGLALSLALGFAGHVSARPAPVYCTAELSNLTIAGDLIVPEGEQCQLFGVTVLADVQTSQRSSLEVIESRIAGTLTGSHFERVSLRDSSVGGRVRLTGGSSAELERARIEGDLGLIGQVDARVLRSLVAGDLVVRGTGEVALLCGSAVEGDARFADHRGGLLIGDDPFAPGYCSANEVRGNLRVHHNTSDTVVANTAVGQNLICTANSPAPLVYGNQVSGKSRGQCGAGEPVEIAELGNDT